jgi:two-component system KDP operon response regulator KdpE
MTSWQGRNLAMGATRLDNGGDMTTAAVRARALLVIEDDAPIRRALRNALSEVTDRLLEAPTGREGIDIAATERPDLVILDLGLPDFPGVDVCREIRSWSRVPILVLSARHSDAEKVQLLNAGADDYVTKPFSTPEFVARVRALLRRARLPTGDDVATVVEGYGLTIDLLHRRVTRGGNPIRLTPIEWDILRALVTNAGRTLTHQQIFDAVWGDAAGNPQQYLRVHITNLRRKVEANPARPELIVTEPGVGYRAELPA